MSSFYRSFRLNFNFEDASQYLFDRLIHHFNKIIGPRRSLENKIIKMNDTLNILYNSKFNLDIIYIYKVLCNLRNTISDKWDNRKKHPVPTNLIRSKNKIIKSLIQETISNIRFRIMQILQVYGQIFTNIESELKDIELETITFKEYKKLIKSKLDDRNIYTMKDTTNLDLSIGRLIEYITNTNSTN